jgi:hypothetical protein
MRNTFTATLLFTAITAAAFTPTGLPADETDVFVCCTPAAIPTFDDFMDVTEGALYGEIERVFEGGDGVLLRPPADGDDETGNRNYTEISIGGGTDGLEAYAFEGFQTGPAAFVGGYEENRSAAKGDTYRTVRRDGGGSMMLSDPAGTMLGISADFIGKDEKAGDDTVGTVTTGFDSGRITAAFRSHFWGTSKLSTKVSDTYSRQTREGPTVTDNLIEADTDFTLLWLGDNSLRGSITLQQENVNVFGGGSTGVLYTRIRLGSDFRVNEKIRLGAGLGGFVLRRDGTLTRLYPGGSIHVGLTRNVGVFANYRPYVRLPAFRELYYETDYTLANNFVPFSDAYSAFEIGVVNNISDVLHADATFYETRFRHDYAEGNVAGYLKTSYYDVGKYYVRGLSFRTQADLHRVISLYGEYGYESVKTVDVPGGHIPYRPRDTLTAGVLVGETAGHHLIAEMARVGERYGDSAGTIILRPAVIANAAFGIRVYRGITFYAKGENLGDATYDEIARVPARGRTVSAGLKMVL